MIQLAECSTTYKFLSYELSDKISLDYYLDKSEYSDHCHIYEVNDDFHILKGCLSLFCSILDKLFIEYQIRPSDVEYEDLPIAPLKEFELRGYQSTSVETILRKHVGIIKAGTGSGKTEIAIAAINSINSKTLVVANRLSYIRQFQKRAVKRGLNPDEIGVIDSVNFDLDKKFIFASLQTLVSRLKSGDINLLNMLDSVDVIVCDEIHKLANNSGLSLFFNLHNVRYIIGLSASPFRDNGTTYQDVMLIGMFKEIIVDIPASWLRAQGYLTDISVVVINIPNKPNHIILPKWHSNWNDLYTQYYTENSTLHEYCASIVENGKYRHTLVFVNRIKLGHILLKFLAARLNRKIILLSGSGQLYTMEGEIFTHDTVDVSDYLEKNLYESDYVLISTPFFQDAIDLPNIDCIIDIAAGSSYIKSVQLPGRGSRIAEDKTNCVMFDFRFAYSTILNKQIDKRIAHYNIENIPTFQI